MEKESIFMLPEDFFERDEVIFLESMQGGYLFSYILLNLHAKFAKNDGKIAVDDMELSAEKTLSLIANLTRVRLIDARRAVEIFLENGFMEERDGFLYLTEIGFSEGREEGAGGGK